MEPRDPDFFQRHLRFHQGLQNESVVLGAILKPQGDPKRAAFEYFYERSIDRMYANFSSGALKPGGQHFFSANVSLPKSLYQRAGGFDPRYRHAEDREFGLRLQRSFQAHFCFLGEAAAYHHSPTGRFEAFVNRARLYGHYDWLISLQHPGLPELNPEQMLNTPNLAKRSLARAAYRWERVASLANKVLIPAAKGLHSMAATRLAVVLCSVLFCCNYMRGLKEVQIAKGKGGPYVS
jgi:hypothetical protein